MTKKNVQVQLHKADIGASLINSLSSSRSSNARQLYICLRFGSAHCRDCTFSEEQLCGFNVSPRRMLGISANPLI